MNPRLCLLALDDLGLLATAATGGGGLDSRNSDYAGEDGSGLFRVFFSLSLSLSLPLPFLFIKLCRLFLCVAGQNWRS